MHYDAGYFKEIEHADIDFLTVDDRDNYKEVIASKGKGIIHVKYYGYGDLEAIVKATAERIVLIAD